MGKRRDSDEAQGSPREAQGVRDGDDGMATTRRGAAISPEYPRGEPRNTLEAVRKRMCSREGILELTTFLGWLLVITMHVAQIWALWWFFWQHVVGDVNQRRRRSESTARLGLRPHESASQIVVQSRSAFAGSLAWDAAQRSVAANRIKTAACLAAWMIWSGAAAVFAVCFHAELFGLTGLVMTLCTNFASYLHQPGKRLFDVGFVIVPEVGRASRLEPLSDLLTGAMPVAAFCYIMLFLDRRRRCRCLTDWLRMMTVVYAFRCITSTMTSLPGPAPHCQSKAQENDVYLPPDTWHDIATSLTTAISGGSCGDLLFSGHAAMTTITTLLLVRQQRRHGQTTERIAKVLGCAYIFFVCIFAVASRKHYTVDLALGTLIGSLTYFRFRDSWSRDPVTLDRMDAAARYYPSGPDPYATEIYPNEQPIHVQAPLLEAKAMSHIV